MSLEDIFALVQELHLDLCHNPDYSKLPFSERDVLVAKCEDLRIPPARASQARRAVSEFSGFKRMADPYLACRRDSIPGRQLAEIVQYYFAYLLPRMPDSELRELYSTIALDLGFSLDTVMHLQTGTGRYKEHRGIIDVKRLLKKHFGGAERTFRRVIRQYSRHIAYDWFMKLPWEKRDATIAGKEGTAASTVYCARRALGTYKRFGGFVIWGSGTKRGPHIRARKKFTVPSRA